MQRILVERLIVVAVIAGLLLLALTLGIWAALLVAVGLVAALALIILVGSGVGPPSDRGTYV